MLSKSHKTLLIAAVVVLFIPVVLLQHAIDPLRKQFEPDMGNTNRAVSQLPIEFALGAATGFKEAVAGLLWVRADDFFDEGDYAAIVPLVRIITWLDPHQVDVYETGAWHMDYNFTDSDNRSDRRYIPLSIALMNEGIANNPRTVDLYGDLGYTHYMRKIDDPVKAQQVFLAGQNEMMSIEQDAENHPHDFDLQTMKGEAASDVTTVGHGLVHAYEAEGNIPAALAQLKWCIDQHKRNLLFKEGQPVGEEMSLGNAVRQLAEMQSRIKYRPIQEKVPCDMGFNAELVRTGPKQFVMQGTLNATGAISGTFNLKTGQAQWGPVDGCRVEIRIQDLGYKMPQLNAFTWGNLSLDPKLTILQDQCSVRAGKFEHPIDMSKDPDMYSFTAPKYEVTMWFNPSSTFDCPINVQDRIGWLGEAMVNPSNPSYVNTSGWIPGDVSEPIPGLKLIEKSFVVTREDLLGTGRKVLQ